MKIKDNILTGDNVQYYPCPMNTKPIKKLAFIVIHFSETTNTNSLIKYIKNLEAEASANIIIGRKGEVIQIVPCNIQTKHANDSMYKYGKEQFNYLNNYSISIMLVNAGKLNQLAHTFYSSRLETIPKDEIYYDRKENRQTTYWHQYTEAQITSLIEIINALRKKYPQIKKILGHSDITKNEIDPGKAFPWDKIRHKV